MRFAISTRNVINRRKTRAIRKKKNIVLLGYGVFGEYCGAWFSYREAWFARSITQFFFVEAQRNVEIVLVGLHEKKANVPGSTLSCGKNKQKPRSLV